MAAAPTVEPGPKAYGFACGRCRRLNLQNSRRGVATAKVHFVMRSGSY